MKNYFSLILALIFTTSNAFGAAIGDDTVVVGKPGSNASKTIKFGAGSGNKPQLRFNATGAQLEFSNNGVDFLGIGSGSGGGSGINLLSEGNFNPDFEVGGNAKWTNSGGTWTTATSGTSLLFGKASSVFTASGAGQYVRSSLVTVTQGLANQPCAGTIYYKGGDANYVLKVLNAAGDLIAYRTLQNAATNATPFTVAFNCGAAGTQYRLSLESTASGALVAFDRTHIGENSLFVSASQISGWEDYTPTGQWTTNTIYRGKWRQVGDMMHIQAKISVTGAPTVATLTINLPTGYAIDPAKLSYLGGGDNWAALGQAVVNDNGSAAYNGTVVYDQPNNRITIVGPTGFMNATVPMTWAVNDSVAMEFMVPILGWSANPPGSVVTPQTAAWKVDVNLGGTSSTPALSIANVATYSTISNPNLTLTQNPGSIATGIACAANSVQAVTGQTSCNSLSVEESLGVVFDLPAAGDVEACFDFTHAYSLNAAGAFSYTTFQLVETPTNAYTPNLQEGKTRFASGNRFSAGSGIQHDYQTPVKICGTFSFATAGQKAIRLAYEHEGASALYNMILADMHGTAGQKDIHVTIRPLTQNVPMPVMIGPQAQTAVKTGAYTMLPSDDVVIGDSTSSAFSITLPSPATAGLGKIVRVTKKNNGGNLLGITGSIAGTTRTTYLNVGGDNVAFISDGSTWNWLSDSYRTESAHLGCGTGFSTNSITSQSGTWISSITQNTTGTCIPQVVSGIFLAGSTPHCTVTAIPSVISDVFSRFGAITATSVTMLVISSSGSLTNEPVMFSCRGPR